MTKATDHQNRTRQGVADPDARHCGYRVRGRVQGVGFRWWTRNQAVRLGLGGSVQNCDDGSVEVWACGDSSSLTELGRLLVLGPPGAQVESVEALSGERRSEPDDFRIVR